MQTRLRLVAALVAYGLSAALPAFAQSPKVDLGLHCIAPARDLRITLRNNGEKDTNVLLGITLGNGRTYHASGLFLEVRRRGSDMIETFQLTDSQPAIAGRVV